jgi:hypothetical protein
MTIYKLFQSRLEVVFDEPDHVVLAVPSNDNPQGNTDQRQESEYTIVSPEEGPSATSSKQILQKQVINEHNTTIVRWWLYAWVPEIRRFQGYPTSQ